MVAWRNGQVEAVPLDAVLAQSPLGVAVNHYLVDTARTLSIYTDN
jgi:ATP-dependent phosphofructokinase / diphosphate-dependent phosphofructokinase